MNPAHKKGLQAYQKSQKKPAPDPAQNPEPQKFKLPLFKETPSKQNPVPPSQTKTLAEGSLRKVAKFLILLGRDEALKVVKHLAPDEVEALGKEISSIPKVEASEAEKILKEFGYISNLKGQSLKGGQAFASAILQGAFGAEKGKKVLHKAVPGSVPPPFSFLQDLDEGAVVTLLAGEPIHVLTVVLNFLPKAQAAKVLARLDKAMQKDLVLRWARMNQVGQEVVHWVEETLKEKLAKIGTRDSQVIDGKQVLAQILGHLGMGEEEKILRELERTSPEVGADLRKRLFTADHILRIKDEDLETILRSMEDVDVAMVLLAAPAPLAEKIKLNISTRRLALVEEEKDLVASRPPMEIKRAFNAFMDRTRELVRSGEARILDGPEEYVE